MGFIRGEFVCQRQKIRGKSFISGKNIYHCFSCAALEVVYQHHRLERNVDLIATLAFQLFSRTINVGTWQCSFGKFKFLEISYNCKGVYYEMFAEFIHQIRLISKYGQIFFKEMLKRLNPNWPEISTLQSSDPFKTSISRL